MSMRRLFVLPSISLGVLFDSHDEDVHARQGKSPCDSLDLDSCTAKLGCTWDDNSCNAHIAWLHVMKCGSSFGTTLAHYANGTLPDTSHIPSGRNQFDPEDRTTEGLQGEPNFFRFKYPVNKWFRNVFRNPPNPGNHLPILDEEWDQWRHNWFGIFREPAARTLSSFYHFGLGKGDLLAFAKKIQGQQASMLSAGAPGMAKIRCEFNKSDAPTQCARMVEPDVVLAIERLDGFAFVGIIEEFDLSVCLFHAMLGSECLSVEFLNMRPGDYTVSEQKKQEQLDALRKHRDPWDEPVYEAAKRRFWGDVRKYGLQPSTCRSMCPGVQSFKRSVNKADAFAIPSGY